MITKRRGVLPLLVLLVFLNSAICHCLEFGHSEGHSHSHGTPLDDQDEQHDCDCGVAVSDYLGQDSAPSLDLQIAPLIAYTPVVTGLAPLQLDVPRRNDRPPGGNAPPRFLVNCVIRC